MISRKNLLAVAVSTTLAAGLVACGGESPEAKVDAAAEKVAAPATAEAPKEGKCGEGKCGGDKADKEGKCGEGKCGGDKAEKEGKCGEGKCGGSK
ncbi:MAG: FIG024746: hypothetical protein [uncultured Thiotrichaceae bacterium]|uniref:Low-complexity protein n=1 Tax=uncultured Thiotrichaceae bacterium TaxID=298394 RepID=A0A6S6UHR6_9GAMM|nr:MAG: FIG024746: hypothetical protein [uncultured Thiotrichaceae bacterium]